MADVLHNDETGQVTIEGVPGVTRWLHQMDEKARKNIRAGFRDVGILVQREARRRAPYKSGSLERSIMFEPGEDFVKVFVPTNSAAGQYAEQKHNGTYRYGVGTLAKGPQAGRKYISRAVTDNADKISSLFLAKLGNM